MARKNAIEDVRRAKRRVSDQSSQTMSSLPISTSTDTRPLDNHFGRVIAGLNALLDLRGSASTLPFVIDKHAPAIRFVLSLANGELAYLTALLVFRGYDVEIARDDGATEGRRRSIGDALRPRGRYQLRTVLKRLRCAWSYLGLLRSPFFPACDGPIEKFLFANYLWGVIAIRTAALNKNVDEIVLNGDFSPADAAMYATVSPGTLVVALIPVFARLHDAYYLRLNSVVTEFRLQCTTDYLPDNIPASKRGKRTQYRMPELRRANTPTITIFLILTTFKGHEGKRLATAIRAARAIMDKYGHENTYKLRPHPYEFTIFKDSREIRKLGLDVTLDMEALAQADLCIVAGTSLVFDLVLMGKPFIFVSELDPYFPNIYGMFHDPVIPYCAKVDDLPSYENILAFYGNDNQWARVCEFVLGDCSMPESHRHDDASE